MEEKMDARTYRIALPLLADADAEARRLGHAYIAPEHLLLAVASHAAGASQAFLARHGLTADALRQSITTLVGAPARADAASEATEPLTIALRSQLALAHAIGAASRRGDSALAFTPDELFGGLLADDVAPGAVVGGMLERAGLNVELARAELAALSAGEAAT
jgi:ATP-dependent Clp protease ATP-binding subunit ClpA